MTSPAADAAREDARQKTGEFGTQTHAESGEVDVDAQLLDQAVAAVLDIADGEHTNVDSFEGLAGGNLRWEVSEIAGAIDYYEGAGQRYPLEMVFEPNHTDPSLPTLQLTVRDRYNHRSVTRRTSASNIPGIDSTGRDAAAAIAKALLVRLPEMRDDLTQMILILSPQTSTSKDPR